MIGKSISRQQRGNRMFQSHEVKGFGEKADVALLQLPLWRRAGANQQRANVVETVKRMQVIMQFEAGHIRKAKIKDEKMGSLRAAGLKSLAARHIMESAMTHFLLDHLNDQHADIHLIINNHDQFDQLLLAHSRRSDSIEHLSFHCA